MAGVVMRNGGGPLLDSGKQDTTSLGLYSLVLLCLCPQHLSAARATAAKPPARKIEGGGGSAGDVATGIALILVGMLSSRRSMPRL